MTSKTYTNFMLPLFIMTSLVLNALFLIMPKLARYYIKANWSDDSFENVYAALPVPTQLSIDYTYHAFVLNLLIATVAVATYLIARRDEIRHMVPICTMWIQFIITWVIMFGYSYTWFYGDSHIAIDPQFSLGSFCSTLYGIFPITLIGLSVMLYGIIDTLRKNNKKVITSALSMTVICHCGCLAASCHLPVSSC